MEVFRREIERALDAELYYPALMIALSLPDVCSALETGDGATRNSLYKRWWDTWLGATYPRLPSEDAYHLRCGVFHQGRISHPKMNYSRILFTLPNSQKITYHNNILNDALNLDLVTFCSDILDAVDAWYVAHYQDRNVVQNLPYLIQYRPEGLPPYMGGMPLIS